MARSLVGGSGSFLSVVGNSGARVGNTPRALEGQGRKAVHGRPIGSPLGHGSIVIRSRQHGNLRIKSADFYCNGEEIARCLAESISIDEPVSEFFKSLEILEEEKASDGAE